MSYSEEYIKRHREIAKVWIIGYRVAKRYHAMGSGQLDHDRIQALAKIATAKRVAGKHITSRDYQYEMTKAAQYKRMYDKARAKGAM